MAEMKTWSKLLVDEMDPWLDRARDLIYPDLRLGYANHDSMISTLAQALYKCHRLASEGGGENQPGTEYIPSVIENVE